jgi:hypothetical protein
LKSPNPSLYLARKGQNVTVTLNLYQPEQTTLHRADKIVLPNKGVQYIEEVEEL